MLLSGLAAVLCGVLVVVCWPAGTVRAVIPVSDTVTAAIRSLAPGNGPVGKGGTSGGAAGGAAGSGVTGASARLIVPEAVRVPGSASALPWPRVGQSVLAVDGAGGVGGPDGASGVALVGSSGPTTRRVPIASVAKVMTAYVILTDHPLSRGQSGPVLTVTAAEAAEYPRQLAGQQSLVRVTAGERLTERQALQALLIASADNVAQILARWDAGSPRAFVAKMNRTAAALGMTRTRYTDPSGLDPATVSTAADQLILARRALAVPELAAIAGQTRAVIPVAGTIRNFNTLLGTDGITGLKTGSTTAAGGCLMFTARHQVGGRTVTLIGVVLGQPGTLATILPKVLAASRALVLGAKNVLRTTTVAKAGQPVATLAGPDGRQVTLTAGSDVTAVTWPGATLRLSVDAEGTDGQARLLIRDVRTASVIATVPLVLSD